MIYGYARVPTDGQSVKTQMAQLRAALPRLMLKDDAPIRVTKRVLAIAHPDPDPSNNPRRSLKALRQRCPILHDRAEHRRRRWPTLRAPMAIQASFPWSPSSRERPPNETVIAVGTSRSRQAIGDPLLGFVEGRFTHGDC